MTNKIENLILNVKEKNKNIFKENDDQMVSRYNGEKETTKDYNGRQLLELIQNADDAGSSEILIEIKKEKSILTISNQGEPFSEEGYRSLMIPNLSSKSKKSYIGNKGLGFRSIINWSNGITIISNNLIVEFSEEIRKKNFEKLFTKEKKSKILKKYGLKEKVIPLPFLAIPIVKDSKTDNNFTTSIKIKFKDRFYEDIIEQVKNLKEEVLLFLNNIKKIYIKGFDGFNNIEIKGKKTIGKPVTISNKKWIIYKKSGNLPKEYQDKDSTEKKYFQLKIAVPINFENETDLLFNFFPTQVNIGFSFVIHGTFDLDSSRNQLVKSDKNKHVLEQLIEFIIETSKKISKNKKISKKKVSWESLKLLMYKNKNTVLEGFDFYKNINKKFEESKLFPCIDDSYRKISDTLMYNEDFTKFIIKTKNIRYFPNLLLPIDQDLKQWLEDDIKLEFYELKLDKFIENKINKISQEIQKIDDRVELIYILEQDASFHSNEHKYSLLLNENKKIIEKAFTPTTKSKTFDLPNFVKIEFLNNDLYKKLLNKYGLSNQDASELQNNLEKIVDIFMFEPNQVIEEIITATNQEISKPKKINKRNFITKQMIQSLFNMYKDIKELKPDTSKVKIITKSGKIKLANELYLSADYPPGKLTEDLFKDIFEKNYFVAGPEGLGLKNEKKNDVENFLLNLLNVNKHSKIKTEEAEKVEEFRNGYVKYVLNHIESKRKVHGKGNLDDLDVLNSIEPKRKVHSADINYSKIEKLEKILKKISKEKLILWLLKDDFLNQQLKDNSNKDKFYFRKRHNSRREQIGVKPSYIKYQLIEQRIFNDFYYTTDKDLSFINEENIDYSHELFKKYKVSKDEIESTLLELGAINDFTKLSIERVSEILYSLEEKDPEGKKAQKLYKLALEHYHKNNNEKILITTDNFKLFSTKEKQSGYFSYSEVYYSDNFNLPQKIITEKPIINLPKRLGEKQISELFSINTFKDFKLKINLNKSEINESMTKKLNSYLTEIKPYIFAFRLNKIKIDNNKQKDQEKRYINNLKINIYNKLFCLIENEEREIEFDNYDFVNEKNTYYIKTNDFSDFEALKNDSDICDVVSEILAMVFKMNETSEFRTCFRDLEDTKHYINKEIGGSILQEAETLLMGSDEKKIFLDSIFKIQNQVKSIEEIKNKYSKELNKIDYENLSEKNNVKYLEKIFKELEISITDFNNESSSEINLSQYHSKKLTDYFHKNEQIFKSSLWNFLNEKPVGEQTNFIDLISEYENNKDFIGEKSNEIKVNFSLNYVNEFKEYINSHFLFPIQKKINIDILDKENRNKRNFNNKENDTIDKDKELKSLRFFEKNISFIKEKLEKLKKKIESENTINESEDNDEIGNIITNSNVKPKKNTIPNGEGPYIPSGASSNKKNGYHAEKIAFNTLVNKYNKENVSWKAKEDEGLHYDMRYSPDNGNSWIYVEVKTFNNNSFILTREERKFGEANKDNYEIWLVDIQKKNIPPSIYPVDIFKKNETYEFTPKDFIVTFKLEIKD